ncbi:MAG: nicotinate-nucleotide adenylyltransferase [Gammaproteobacteria bacterium]|nr:nicotinate-nucleotide adenylyltransferase [Gammaproteobacteria bacterium]
MIGILGGTFDPVHEGHFHIAMQVLNRLGLEQVQFVPCALPVHRDEPHASASERCAMIELMIADEVAFVLNTLELDRGGLSFMIDSLREIRVETGSTLVLVLGADAFNDFASWKAPHEILQLVHLVVCHRPGYEVDPETFREYRVDFPVALSERSAGAILMLEVDANDCSSSEVRAALAQGHRPEQCVRPVVAHYIDEHHLYRKTVD